MDIQKHTLLSKTIQNVFKNCELKTCNPDSKTMTFTINDKRYKLVLLDCNGNIIELKPETENKPLKQEKGKVYKPLKQEKGKVYKPLKQEKETRTPSPLEKGKVYKPLKQEKETRTPSSLEKEKVYKPLKQKEQEKTPKLSLEMIELWFGRGSAGMKIQDIKKLGLSLGIKNSAIMKKGELKQEFIKIAEEYSIEKNDLLTKTPIVVRQDNMWKIKGSNLIIKSPTEHKVIAYYKDGQKIPIQDTSKFGEEAQKEALKLGLKIV